MRFGIGKVIIIRQVSVEEGKQLAASLGMKFMETSAKTKHNIENVFLALTRQIYENMPDEMTNTDDGVLTKKNRKKDKGTCC